MIEIKRVALYARFSSDHQRTESIDAQIRAMKQYCKENRWRMRCMRYQPDKRAIIIDHVGNVHRFGLPDEERQWTLDPKPQKKQEKTVSVKQCTECFYTHAPAPICPKCGHVYEKTEREIMEERKEQELEKIERRVSMMHSASECKSMKELSVYAKQHGYKPGWAYHQAKALGIFKKKEKSA